jgi:YidC/Oxa1 family membrane protein insertase
MHAIGQFFDIALIRPLLNLMVVCYNYVPGHNIGLVIILVTVIVRLILSPSMHKALKGQRSISAMQPKMNAIREKHKDDRVAQSKALMELYKEHNYNPMSSCLPTLIQLPILLALYRVFVIGLGNSDLAQYLYHGVHNPGIINPMFIWGINLAHTSWILGIIAGLLQFWQTKMMFSKMQKSNDPTQNAMQTQTLYILPALTVIISFRVPGGLPLYWIVTTLFAIVQQWIIMRDLPTDHMNDKVQVVS